MAFPFKKSIFFISYGFIYFVFSGFYFVKRIKKMTFFEKNDGLLSRRVLALALFQMFIFLGLILRLYHLQMVDGAEYCALSDRRRIALKLIDVYRGNVFDRQNVLLGTQKQSFHAFFQLHKNQPYHRELLLALKPVLSLSTEEIDCIEKDFLAGKKTLIKADLSWKELSELESNPLKWFYVSIETHSKRIYLYPESCAHPLGYVSLNPDPQSLMNGYLGKGGVEKKYESKLGGKRGYEALEINAKNQVKRKLKYIAPCSGRELRLSIDVRLQNFIYEKLKDYQSASAVVLDLKTGEILANVSFPSFNSNFFSGRISMKEWGALMRSEHAPLMNKVISGVYPPASTLKGISILAGLKSKTITKTDRVFCKGFFEIGQHVFHCHNRYGHGWVNAQTALKKSCDVFFYWLAQRLKITDFTQTAEEFGLGELLLNQFPQEKKGVLPSPEWKMKHHHRKWTRGDTALTLIGQGYFLTTPLQMVVMMGRIATGKKIIPTFEYQNTVPLFENVQISEEDLDFVQEGLESVVNAVGGTAYRFRLNTNFQMAGKTGTAQVCAISQKRRALGLTKTDDLPWKFRDHSLFCGYAPDDDPRYGIAVVLEHGVTNSARLAKEVFEFMASEKNFSFEDAAGEGS
jgi:penicillin-binding protein 2